jgi:IrrE N-terminal-like domain
MTTEQLVRLAAEFRERARVRPGERFDLEGAVVRTTPVFVVRLRRLRPVGARNWLWQRGTRLPLAVEDRPLAGCVVAYRGQAGIFLERALSAEDARAVLAHEFAHYLAHYELPRSRVARRLGASVLPALDGERPASETEGLAAALAGVPLEVHTHCMDRGFDPGRVAAVDAVERGANGLACELLAPRREVLGRARTGRLPEEAGAWARLLREEFGLPESWAVAYAGHLVGKRPRRSFSETLGI